MKISAKEILIVILGIIATLLFTISDYFKIINLKNPSTNDILIIFVVIIVSLGYVLFKRIGEVDKEIENINKSYNQLNNKIKEDYNKLEEKIKIYKDINELKVRVDILERKNGA